MIETEAVINDIEVKEDIVAEKNNVVEFASRFGCHLSTKNKSTVSNDHVTKSTDKEQFKIVQCRSTSHMTYSTNGKVERPTRKDIRLPSPKSKKLSPKLSPKMKLKLSHLHKKSKIQPEAKSIVKMGSQSDKKAKQVKELIKNFEANIEVKENTDATDTTDTKKERCRDAFEALMMKRDSTGDTQKRTPVRTRVKRLENTTSGSQSILKWARKSSQNF